MKQKELTKDNYDDFKLQKPFGLYDLYKKYFIALNVKSFTYAIVVIPSHSS